MKIYQHPGTRQLPRMKHLILVPFILPQINSLKLLCGNYFPLSEISMLTATFLSGERQVFYFQKWKHIHTQGTEAVPEIP